MSHQDSKLTVLQRIDIQYHPKTNDVKFSLVLILLKNFEFIGFVHSIGFCFLYFHLPFKHPQLNFRYFQSWQFKVILPLFPPFFALSRNCCKTQVYFSISCFCRSGQWHQRMLLLAISSLGGGQHLAQTFCDLRNFALYKICLDQFTT